MTYSCALSWDKRERASNQSLSKTEKDIDMSKQRTECGAYSDESFNDGSKDKITNVKWGPYEGNSVPPVKNLSDDWLERNSDFSRVLKRRPAKCSERIGSNNTNERNWTVSNKGLKSQSPYSADLGDAEAFKPDTSFFKNPLRGGEGVNAGRPKFKDYAGGLSDRRRPVDSDLKYSGANEGYEGD
jgi:hypothetical protein